MLNKEKRKYLKQNIGKITVDEIAKGLHVRPDEVRAEIKRLGLDTDKNKVVGHTALPFNKTLAVLILSILIIGAYANAISGDFVWDDQTIIVRNDAIKSFGNVPYVLSNQFAEMAKYRGNIYRPMQEISYMFDNLLWGIRPAGFHITSILLQLLTALLLFYTVLSISQSTTVAFTAAAIFGIHPINTEAVTYISGRSDPLYLAFLLASLLFYIKSAGGNKQKNALHYLCAVVFYIFSIMSRETAVVFPLILIAYERFAARVKTDWRKLLPFFAVVLFYAILRLKFIPLDRSKLAFPGANFIILTDVRVMAEYMKILIFPFSLHMERGIAYSGHIDMWAAGGLVSIILLFAISFRAWKNSRSTFFWAIWFIIFLLPYLNIVTLNAQYAEHWIYAAAIGLYVILADFLEGLAGNGRLGRVAAYSLFIVIIAYLGYLTVIRNKDWRDEPSIYSNTLKYRNSPRVASNLGVYYDIHEQYDKAIESYERALAVAPNETLYHNNIAIVYMKTGDMAKAIEHWEKSLAIYPDQPQVKEFLARYKSQ